jgi:hypothetical protein
MEERYERPRSFKQDEELTMRVPVVLVTLLWAATITLSCDVTHADAVGVLEPLLEQGDLDGAAEAMLGRVDRDNADNEARLGLGVPPPSSFFTAAFSASIWASATSGLTTKQAASVKIRVACPARRPL